MRKNGLLIPTSQYVLACLGLLLVSATIASAADEPLNRVRVQAVDAANLALELEASGFDVLQYSIADRTVDVVVTGREWIELERLGLDPVFIERGRPLREILAERDGPPPGYPELSDIIAQMQNAAAAHPEICQFVDLTEHYNVAPTVEGRHLYAVKITDNVWLEEDEPAYLLVTTHHAREIVTPLIGLHAIEQLTTQYNIDPTITDLVNQYEIWVAPMWNPDGYEFVFNGDNMWRKNRRVFSEGIGVDLNRNYPFGWDSPCSGDTYVPSQTYRGPEPASEAETQTMIAWAEDRHFAKVADYHSAGREVRYGYGCWTNPIIWFLEDEAVALSQASGYGGDIGSSCCTAGDIHFHLGTKGSHAFLWETHVEFQPSYQSALDEAAMLFPGVIWHLQRPIPLWGYVTDATTGEPVVAEINFEGVTYVNGEINTSFGEWGRYHAFLPPGTYNIIVEADGYDLVTVNNVVVTTGSTQVNVQLSGPPQLLSPNGGENLPVNVATTVSWDGDPALSYHAQYTANYGNISVESDGFESGVLDPAYSTGGDALWSVVGSGAHSGTYCAKAGGITDNQSTWMTRTVGGGELSFWWRVSSENNYDFFNFYISGAQELHEAGESGWQFYTTTLPPGTYELKWEYNKDYVYSSGDDTAWIDDLQIMVDSTEWVDIIPLTAPGAMSTPWTPTVVSDDCKVRVRAWYDTGGYFGVFDESDDVFSVVAGGGPADINGDGVVDVLDLLMLLSAWGPCAACPEDINGDGEVDVLDLLQLLASWS